MRHIVCLVVLSQHLACDQKLAGGKISSRLHPIHWLFTCTSMFGTRTRFISETAQHHEHKPKDLQRSVTGRGLKVGNSERIGLFEAAIKVCRVTSKSSNFLPQPTNYWKEETLPTQRPNTT